MAKFLIWFAALFPSWLMQPGMEGITQRPLVLDAAFDDNRLITVVCAHGDILTSSDGGKVWTPNRYHGRKDSYQGICFPSDRHGVIIGGIGTILLSDSGIQRWREVESGTTSPLQSISFLDENRGCCVGMRGVILLTRDGGRTWTTSRSLPWSAVTPARFEWLTSVHFVDDRCLVAVGYNGEILRSDDGGNEWKIQESHTSSALASVRMFNSDSGLAAGSGGTILRTTDAGKNWTSATIASTGFLQHLLIVNPHITYASGSNGVLLKSLDAGLVWKTLAFETQDDVSAICKTNDTLWLFGRSGTITKLVNDRVIEVDTIAYKPM